MIYSHFSRSSKPKLKLNVSTELPDKPSMYLTTQSFQHAFFVQQKAEHFKWEVLFDFQKNQHPRGLNVLEGEFMLSGFAEVYSDKWYHVYTQDIYMGWTPESRNYS